MYLFQTMSSYLQLQSSRDQTLFGLNEIIYLPKTTQNKKGILMTPDTKEVLSSTTKYLHSIVALFMIGLLAVGVYMVETDTRSLYSWHKSFGVIALVFVTARVLWRIKNGWLIPLGTYSKLEQFLSKLTHWVLILGTLILPISGIAMSYFNGRGVAVFGFQLIARNPSPDNPAKVIAHNEALASFFHGTHHWISYLIIGAIVIHIIGALKHHIIDKDDTLKRMKP